MKLFSIFFFILFAQLSWAANPDWMVRIEKKLLGNGKINGTGYLVEIKGKHFVRTAAHVTLGSIEGVSLYDYKNSKLEIEKSGVISNNALDDQLIEVKGQHQVLATFARRNNQFVIEHPRSQSVQRSAGKVMVSTFLRGSFYVSPSWIKRTAKDNLKANYISEGAALNDSDTSSLRYSRSGESIISRMHVIPGESGSPLIAEGGYIMNDQGLDGRPLNIQHPNGTIVTIVTGHVLGYHRLLKHSNFSTPDAGPELVKAFENGKRGDISGVVWKFLRGTPYRSQTINGRLYEEAYFGLMPHAGDGTSGNGGDGTSGNGGDGTSGNGGDGTSGNGGDGGLGPKPRMGMVYDSQPIYAFRVTPNDHSELAYVLYANWENYRYLMNHRQHLSFEAIDFSTPLQELIEERAKINLEKNYFQVTGSCRIDQESLRRHQLRVVIQDVGILTKDISPAKLADFLPIDTLTISKKQKVNVDVRGLWSLDLSMTQFESTRSGQNIFGKSRDQKLKTTPFIMVGVDGQNYRLLECALVN